LKESVIFSTETGQILAVDRDLKTIIDCGFQLGCQSEMLTGGVKRTQCCCAFTDLCNSKRLNYRKRFFSRLIGRFEPVSLYNSHLALQLLPTNENCNFSADRLKYFHRLVQTGEVLIESHKKEGFQTVKAIFCASFRVT
jgi:hypothetical protein